MERIAIEALGFHRTTAHIRFGLLFENTATSSSRQPPLITKKYLAEEIEEREDSNTLSQVESKAIYPFSDRGDGWVLEIKITSAKSLSSVKGILGEIRKKRNEIGDLLEILNSSPE